MNKIRGSKLPFELLFDGSQMTNYLITEKSEQEISRITNKTLSEAAQFIESNGESGTHPVELLIQIFGMILGQKSNSTDYVVMMNEAQGVLGIIQLQSLYDHITSETGDTNTLIHSIESHYDLITNHQDKLDNENLDPEEVDAIVDDIRRCQKLIKEWTNEINYNDTILAGNAKENIPSLTKRINDEIELLETNLSTIGYNV